MLPYLVTKGHENISPNENFFLRALLATLYPLVQGIRMFFSGLLTFISLPVIGTVGLIADIKARQLREDVQDTVCEYFKVQYQDAIPEEKREELYQEFDIFIETYPHNENSEQEILFAFQAFLESDEKYAEFRGACYGRRKPSSIPKEERETASDHLPQMQSKRLVPETTTFRKMRIALNKRDMDNISTSIDCRNDIIIEKQNTDCRHSDILNENQIIMTPAQARNNQAFFELNIGGIITNVENNPKKDALEATYGLRELSPFV